MTKAEAENLFQDAIKDLIDICPHCNAKAHLKLEFAENHLANNRDLIFYATFRCVPCRKLVLKTFKFAQNKYSESEDLKIAGWQLKFPSDEITYSDKFNGPVPETVLEDFKEGVVCLLNKCPKAAVSMFRRSLQSSLLEKGSNPKEDLIDQIKKAPFLTEDIKD